MTLNEQGRTEPPYPAGPVEQVMGFHAFLRETLLWKCDGLTEDQLRWSPVPSGTCLVGIVKHSVYVERWWISRYISGVDLTMPWSEADPDADFRIEPDESFASIRAMYLAEAARTADILAGADWNTIPPDPSGKDRGFNVGWILTHMVEEVARHCGHADLIRELLDGQTGE